MSDGLLDRLGLGAVAGFAIGVAVTSNAGEQRTLREFARDILAECHRLLEDPRLAAALPAIPASTTAPAPRRRRRTRAQIEADAAAAAAAAAPVTSDEPRPRRRGRAAAAPAARVEQSAAAGSTATPGQQPSQPARRGRRPRQQPGETGNTTRAAAPVAREQAAVASAATDREAEGAAASDNRINLNTATRGQLMRLPRIGAQAADRIIAFREQNGPIRNIRQLRQAEVIPVSAARQMRDQVRF